MIFVDASFLVSFALDIDANHSQATAIPLNPSHSLNTSEDVIKETLTVISQRKGKQFCIEFIQEILLLLNVLPVTTARYEAGLQYFLDPKLSKDISLIDCISVAICKEVKIRKILTFDRHFKSFGFHIYP